MLAKLKMGRGALGGFETSKQNQHVTRPHLIIRFFEVVEEFSASPAPFAAGRSEVA